MNKGIFISIEGGEGAGKSSLITKLAAHLSQRGADVVATREPGGIAIAEQIRSVILNTANTAMDGRTEALLYAAARRQHLVEKVIPALERGSIVLCDRFIDSSLAYQGYARGLGIEKVLKINEFAIGGVMPNLTLYMDVPPEIGLARIEADRGREVNRLDLETERFHSMVREGFQQLLNYFPERLVQIDAVQSPERVLEDVLSVLRDRLNL